MNRNRKPALSKEQRAANNRALRRAISYLSKYRALAVLPYLFLIVSTSAMLLVPRMVRNIIDAVTNGVIAKTIVPQLGQIPAAALEQIFTRLGLDQEQLVYNADNAERLLITAVIAILVFALVRGIFAFLQAYYAERNSQNIAYDLRNELFAKIQHLSFSYHDQNQTGQLMIRATDDIEKVRVFIGQGLIMALGAVILLVGTLIILFSTNVRLTLIMLPIMPLAGILFMAFAGLTMPLFARIQQKISTLNTVLQENLAGIRVVKAFTREKSEQKRFNSAADDLVKEQLVVARAFSFLFPFMFLLANLGQAVVLYFGGRQIVEGTLTLGQWQEFSLYLVYLFMPIAQLGMIVTQMSQAAASAARIFEILDAKNEVTDRAGAIALPSAQGHVEFQNVTFSYLGGGEPVLKNVSFEAQPGQTIALLGATGSGKTTIINLIPRFYDPTEGAIKVDGHDLRDVTIESLRQQIGIVLQETTLFAGTIRDNIAYGRPEASDDEVQAAAKAAMAHEFILSFPDGYDTKVGERGTTLSGGQRQRVAIARALLMDPRILILDDSTSSVDLETEYQIQKALDQLQKDRTSFVIAQRISTVLNADKILVLERGQISAQGTHEQLLEESEIYAEIYSSQLVEDAALEEPVINNQ